MQTIFWYCLAVEAATGFTVETARFSYCTTAGGFTEHNVPINERNRAMGIEALTVKPARRPTYTVTAPNRIPKIAPKTTARTVNSGTLSFSATYGRNSPGGAVELQPRFDVPSAGLATTHLRECA